MMNEVYRSLTKYTNDSDRKKPKVRTKDSCQIISWVLSNAQHNRKHHALQAFEQL